jgi:hypothetical protein
MSKEQKEMMLKFWSVAMSWLTRGLLAANLFFLTEVYADFKGVKVGLEIVKQEVSALSAKVDILTNFDLKSRK